MRRDCTKYETAFVNVMCLSCVSVCATGASVAYERRGVCSNRHNPPQLSNNPFSSANFFLDWTGRDNLGLGWAVGAGVLLIHLERPDRFNIHRSCQFWELEKIWVLCIPDFIERKSLVVACWAAAVQSPPSWTWSWQTSQIHVIDRRLSDLLSF